MQDWQTRVVEEQQELKVKINKLRDFMLNNRATLSALDYDTMAAQLQAMQAYNIALSTRIKRF